MKNYIGKIETLEAVPSEQYPAYNEGYNVTHCVYAVISEDETPDPETTRVTFIMWTEEFSDEQIDGILKVLNK